MNSCSKFCLKVGGVLYQRGSDVGLKPDGLITKSESEKIEAERILNANIPDLTFMNVLECVFLITRDHPRFCVKGSK